MSTGFAQKIRALEQKVQASPGDVGALAMLSQLYCQTGQYVDAATAARSAVNQNPDNAAAQLALIESLTRQNKLNLANQAVDRAMQTATGTPELLAKMAEVRQIAGRLPEADALMERALAKSPDNLRMRFQRAHLLLARCRYGDASDAFTTLSEGRFFRSEAFGGIANACERQRDLEKAQHFIGLALQCSHKPSAFVLNTLADIALQTGKAEEAIGILTAATNRTDLPAMDLAGIHFALGRLLDKCGRYGDAFRHFAEGNKGLAPDHDWRKLGEQCQKLRTMFSREAIASMPVASAIDTRPVFIVGLPRSGTSLVERILASHPDVHGAGELEQIHYIARQIERRTDSTTPGPEALSKLEPGLLDRLASTYSSHLDTLTSTATRIIDKMPGNLMYLGLIHALLPQARVIHCVRNPLDTCLSCFFQRFHRSNPLAYTFSLEGLAYTWREQEQLMAHWKSVLPIPIMDVAYEDLVNDFDSTTNALLEFCGLEWNEDVRSFHESDLDCHTASYAQVRKPIYKSSLNRWRNYEPYIQTLINTLGIPENEAPDDGQA